MSFIWAFALTVALVFAVMTVPPAFVAIAERHAAARRQPAPDLAACQFCTIGGAGKRCTCADPCEEMFCMAGRTVGSRD